MPNERRRAKVESGAEITAEAAKQGVEGVSKGVVDAADTTTHFQYAPTLIALFPVFASFFFGSHTEHWTDLILLALVAVYLHNCVSVPWNYYKVAKKRYRTSDRERMTERQREISKQLRYAQSQAFGGLILGPLMGAALLHYVRNSMARPANGLITNFNITVFVLAAELRPLKIAFQYLNSRAEELQDELVDVVPERYEDILRQVKSLDDRLKEVQSDHDRQSRTLSQGSVNGSAHAKQDAVGVEEIKHALRRFERHESQLQQHYDQRLYALEKKLAAANQRPLAVDSGRSTLGRLIHSCFMIPIEIGWATFTLPLRTLQALLTLGNQESKKTL